MGIGTDNALDILLSPIGDSLYIVRSSIAVDQYNLPTNFDLVGATLSKTLDISGTLGGYAALNGAGDVLYIVYGTTFYNYEIANPVSDNWVDAQSNNMFQALVETSYNNNNILTSGEMHILSDDELVLTGGPNMDFSVIMENPSKNTSKFNSATLNYDGNLKNEMAIPGTDYTFSQYDLNLIRFNSLIDGNLKIKIL